MIDSKKALDLAILEYEKDLEYDDDNQWVINVLKGLKEVKQDLEKLEKENKVLREKVNHFKNVKNRYRRNQKFVEKENDKLKKTIDYLKDNFKLKISKSYNEDGTIKYILFSDRTALKYGLIVREENIELLKEVLSNEN